MELGISKEMQWYKPKYPKGNELLPDEKAVMIEIKVLDYKDKMAVQKNFKNWTVSGTAANRDEKKERIESNVLEVSQKIFRDNTGKVKNVEINGVSIKTGTELIDTEGVPAELIDDVSNALMNESKLKEAEVKN